MHLEKTLGIQRVAVQADLHQPGTRQHKHHKMHHRLLAGRAASIPHLLRIASAAITAMSTVFPQNPQNPHI